MPSSISSREVNAALRRLVWPELRERGFADRTQRTAWSDRADCVAVVNFHSFNSYRADGIGATTFSFGLNLGVRALCSSLWGAPKIKDGRLRPRVYECHVRRSLWKTIEQPELARPAIWYVRPDGSNVESVVEDARSSLLGTGMAWLDEFSDLRRMLEWTASEPEEMESGGTFAIAPLGSAPRRQLVADLHNGLRI